MSSSHSFPGRMAIVRSMSELLPIQKFTPALAEMRNHSPDRTRLTLATGTTARAQPARAIAPSLRLHFERLHATGIASKRTGATAKAPSPTASPAKRAILHPGLGNVQSHTAKVAKKVATDVARSSPS